MPRATVSQDTKRIELKSCPGGFVDLRTLTFHEMNTRSDIATRMYQEQTTGGKNKKKREPDTVRGYFEIMNVAVTEYEFRNCIVSHNLEDENGELIDFTRPMQAWRLDPKIGQEINKAIDELNQLEDDEEDLTPLESQLLPFSSGVETQPSPSTASE